MNEFEKEINTKTNERGQIDLNDLGKAIDEADERADQRILDHNEKIRAKEEAKLKEEQEEVNSLMKALSDKVKADDEAEAQREFNKEKERADKELQKEIYLKHNIKTDHQKERDEAYKGMLKGLNI